MKGITSAFVSFLIAAACAATTIQTIDHQAQVNKVVPDDLIVAGDVNGQSSAYLESTGGGVLIHGKVDGQSAVTMVAAGAAQIDYEIDGASNVTIWAIGNVTIGRKIDGGSQVKVYSRTGSVTFHDKFDNGSTLVQVCAPHGNVTGPEHGPNAASFRPNDCGWVRRW